MRPTAAALAATTPEQVAPGDELGANPRATHLARLAGPLVEVETSLEPVTGSRPCQRGGMRGRRTIRDLGQGVGDLVVHRENLPERDAKGHQLDQVMTYATLLRSQVLTDDIASKPLADLKPSHVEQLAVRMRVKGCSPSTVRQTYTVLRSVLETAVRDELLATNPAARVKRPGVQRTEARYLTIAEVAVLLEAAKDSRYAPLLRLLVSTGLACGEALALRWQDVDLTTAFCGSVARYRGSTGTWSSVSPRRSAHAVMCRSPPRLWRCCDRSR